MGVGVGVGATVGVVGALEAVGESLDDVAGPHAVKPSRSATPRATRNELVLNPTRETVRGRAPAA